MTALDVEWTREKRVREVPCPEHEVRRRQPCTRSDCYSCTARYNLAAERGLVPALPVLTGGDCTCH